MWYSHYIASVNNSACGLLRSITLGTDLDDIDSAIYAANYDYTSSTHAFIVSYIEVDNLDDQREPEVSHLFLPLFKTLVSSVFYMC